MTWVIAVVLGLVLGAAIGAFQGAIVAYIGVPSFIVTLGGFLVWRGLAWWTASGQTIAPMDSNFRLLGGGAEGTIGGTWSWIIGVVACVGIVLLQITKRRQRVRYGFRLRPMWAEITLGAVACGGRPDGRLVPEPVLPPPGPRRAARRATRNEHLARAGLSRC